jgi:hypothetical protein
MGLWPNELVRISELRDSGVAWIIPLVAIPLLTFSLTSLQYFAASSKAKDQDVVSEPPLVPYSIPFIGHAIPFAFDTANYLSNLRCVFILVTVSETGEARCG